MQKQNKKQNGNYMGEIVIMGIGFDRPTVTLPMTATKEEIVGAIVATTQEEETETGK